MASVKPISTIRAAFPSSDVLFSLAVVVVVVVAVGGGGAVVVAVAVAVAVVVVAAVVVVRVLVSLLPCNLSSTRPGGMREAIE